MNGIESLNGSGFQTEAKPESMGPELGKDDFLNLLVTQLKNQDPLNPSDPTEFTAQLAQFSSLEQLHNISSGIKSLGSFDDGLGRLSALSLIGKDVIAETDSFRFEGNPVQMGFRFNEQTEKVVVHVKKENGQVVDKVEIERPASGENFLQWDGKDSAGNALPNGKYTFSAIGTMTDGTEVKGSTIAGRRVTGVDFSEADSALLTPDGKIGMSGVIRVNNPTLSDDEQG